MTIKPEVLAAVERTDFCVDRKRPVDWGDWRALRAELLAMDAEIERLNAWAVEYQKNMRAAYLRDQSRLATANALLRSEAAMLRAWARESREGGWSTHQVAPMNKRADEIDAAMDAMHNSAREVGE